MKKNVLLMSTGGGLSIPEEVDVEYVVFLNCENDLGEYLGKRSYLLKNAPDIRNKYILVLCRNAEYAQYYQYLRRMGFEEWKDFIYYPLCGKKICFLNMNCHALPTEYYLNHSRKFREQYAIYPLMPAKGHSAFYTLDDETLSRIDLFLYQNMLPTNLYGASYADEFTLPRLKKTCQAVSMPNFCPLGEGIFQTQTSMPIRYMGADAFSQDLLIEEAYEKCDIKDISHLLRYIHHYTVDEDIVRKKFESTWNRILNRENRWNIKISDYFIKNFRNVPMVIDISHPSKYLMLEICHRLMEYLKMEDSDAEKEKIEEDFYTHYSLGTHGIVYPYIRKILKIEYPDEKIRKGFIDYIRNAFFNPEKTLRHEDGMTLMEYIQEYVYVRKGVLLEYKNKENLSDEQHVINCYRYILGREPENNDVVIQQANFTNLTQLRYRFLTSPEFKEIYKKISN